jgi:hypothetical protein
MPALTVPAGLTDDGLPVGMEILARRYDEPTMFQIGYGFEQVASHRVGPRSTTTFLNGGNEAFASGRRGSRETQS